MDDFEERYKDAIEAGQRNLRAAKLVSNWCFHAEINRSGGRGLIEAETGLPIGHMGLQCKHSKKNSMHTWLLEDAAYDFYLNNCRNCTERTAVGIPNIMEFIAPREEAAKTRRSKREADEAKRLAERKSREEKRALLRYELALEETFVLDLVDELDRDEVSGDDPRLEKLADLAPETFTRQIVELLLPDVLHEHLPYSIPAAKALLRASLEDAEKVAVAVRLVGAYEQSAAAIDVVLKNSERLSGDDLKKVLHRFTHLALGPPPGMHVGGSRPMRLDASPVKALYAKRTDDVLEVVGTLIDNANPGKIGAAAQIILAVDDDQLLLEHSRAVIAKLMRRRKLLSNERHDSSVLYYLREAASRCLDHFPEETDRIIQSFLADMDEVGEREAFRTYRSVLKHSYREKAVIGEAQRIAFKRLLWAAVTNPERRMDDATQFFRHSWDEFAPLAIEHFDDLIGAAATLSEKYEAVGSEYALETVNDTLAEMERRNKRTTIDSLQGALIAWAALGAQSKGRDGIEDFLSLYRRLPEDQVQMRGNMIVHVSKLLTGVQSLNLVLSDWYRALMDESALVRASAVQAWENVPYELIQHFPDLFFEAFAVSLTDPYVIVHKSAIHALRRRSIPKEKRGLVQGGIWNLILHYANDRKTSDFTVDCIDVLEYLFMTKEEVRGRSGQVLSSILLSLEERALYHAVYRLYLSFLHAPGFVKVALKALQDDYTRSISIDDCETTILRAPSDELRKCVDELQEAFETFSPFRVEDFRTLLVLASACSRAGRFDIGATRFKQITEYLPDNDRSKLWRLETALVASAFEFERTVGEGGDIVDISESWGGLAANLEKENAERANLRDFRRAFSSRVEVALAIKSSLQAPTENLDRLKTAIPKLEAAVAELGDGDVEDQYRAYWTACSIFVILAEWKHALRNAEPDAGRFLSSAKIKSSEIETVSTFGGSERLTSFLELVAAIVDVGQLQVLTDHLNRWQLPLLLFARAAAREYRGLRVPGPGMADEKPEKLDTSVAFLKFDIDGEPAQKWNYMAPGTAYDLTIEVRVSNWPPNARKLTLVPIAVEVLEQGWLPEFSFSKPTGEGPYMLTGTKRAVLQVAQSFGSRPYEFKYAAEFDDISHCREVAIVGHRQLRLEGTDISSNPLTGFSNVDRHLVRLRDRLRTFPGLNPTDLANTMVVLGGLGNIAAQALRQGMFTANTSESSFQEKVIELLRNRPGIGEKLQGHPEAAGGITDLTFEDVPIELKVENSRVLYPKDFEKYFDQTAAYALGLGKKIGVLCVLESAEKDAPVGAPEDDIDTFVHQTGKSSTAIAVVVVRGGFPKPSAYSKAAGKRTKSAS